MWYNFLMKLKKIDFYKNNPQAFHKDQRELSALMGKNDVKYGAWTLSFEMGPVILDNSDSHLIKSAVEKTVPVKSPYPNEATLQSPQP